MALQDFAGSVVLVSHDRHLVAATCDELWRVAEGEVSVFDGDLDDYQRWLSTRNSRSNGGGGSAKGENARPSAKDVRRNAAQERERIKLLKDNARKLEQKMAKLQKRLAELDTLLQDPTLYEPAGKAKLAPLTQEQRELRKQLTQVEEEWLGAAGEAESLEG